MKISISFFLFMVCDILVNWICEIEMASVNHLTGIYLFKFKSGSTGTVCEICSKLGTYYSEERAKTWPTKDTAVYVTFEGQKLRGQFSENLVLRISEFLFNLVVKFPKKKELWKFWELKMKIWQKF